MSTKGIGWGGAFGLLGMMIVIVIVASHFVRNVETGVEAKEHAEKTVDEVKKTIRAHEAARESIMNANAERGLPGFGGSKNN